MQDGQKDAAGIWGMKDWAGHLAIAALLIGLIVWVRDDIADLRAEVRAENAALRDQVADLQQRTARVEGLVEGLRPVFAAAEAPTPKVGG